MDVHVNTVRARLSALLLPWCIALAMTEAQAPPARPAQSLSVVTASGRRPIAISVIAGHDMVALEELAAIFHLAVREEPSAGGVTISYNSRTIALTPGQTIASVGGRLVSLPAPVARDGRRWLVPVEFVARALAPIYDARIEARLASRLVIVGDLRVPRVVASIEPAGARSRVTVEITPQTGHAVTQEPGRLLIRFQSDALDLALPAAPPGSGPTVELIDPANLIAVDYGSRYATFRTSAEPTGAGGERLIIDLLPPAAQAGPLAEVAVPPSAQAPPVSSAEAGPATVVLDAGHGGDEGGAKGPGGLLEKDVTLALARQLRTAIEARLGLRVLLTRDADVTVPLEDRTALANNNKAELFVSLHANASPLAEARGAEVFFLSAGAVPATGEARDRELVPALGGGSREIDVILWEMAQTRFLAESSTFAEMIGQELESRVEVNRRRIEQAPFRVLVGANMPAVLVEVGFLSNPEQERQLQSPSYQSLIVQGLLGAISRFHTYLDRSRSSGGPPLVTSGFVGRQRP